MPVKTRKEMATELVEYLADEHSAQEVAADLGHEYVALAITLMPSGIVQGVTKADENGNLAAFYRAGGA